MKGFRSDSTVVVETTLQSLWDTGVRVYHGAPGVLLTTDVAPEGLRRILGLTEGSTEFGLEVASYSPTDRVLKLLDQSGAHVDAPEPAPEGEEQELPEGDTEQPPAKLLQKQQQRRLSLQARLATTQTRPLQKRNRTGERRTRRSKSHLLRWP